MRRVRREIVGLAIWAVTAGAAPTAPATADRKLANGMAAKVAGQVITVRDARFFLALQRFRDGKPDPMGAEGPGELRSAVQRLLLEEMVHAELRSLKFEGGPRSDAEKALGRKKGSGAKLWNSLLKTYGKSEATAVDLVWRSLQVEKFIQRRVDTMTPIVTAAEVDRYLRQKAATDKRVSEEELVKLRPGAAQELKKELMRKELEEWIVLLKRKYQVTNYLEG